ncbi:hypothetical protein NCAS_0D03940 [Naumovozyma castellii]|uniref:Ams2/SPT21 N-terminal domain-containing protein n=1 Tax=Naumovozyma castellii TaxID=27288 RepID=G0VEI4_NAUCA|nr:hypothetical protein NCAS_0D03940 [Naumovozyma castellii CBS 4309]CCC69975.1 hypothetical protein NCAS_0D03940 [Naumovozyma castellii CBS 4309]
MTELINMTLKILYTVDNGSTGSYLARSKRPYPVRVANIPNPIDSNATTLRIGAVDISTALNEIYLNSPEVFDLHNNNNRFHDYNLYFKDICENDEPLVSLGLLSKIRSKILTTKMKENGSSSEDDDENDDEEDDEDDSSVVTGRVCSNFSALLRRTYSNASRKKSSAKNDESTTSETLEVKLRFSKVITGASSRRSSGTLATSPKILAPPQEVKVVTTKMSRPIMKPMKRQTNPMPAPKAKRTQSLPIWNLKQPTVTGLPKNSIAHKIFMADRKTEATNNNNININTVTNNASAVLSYEIDSLQSDNSIQKIKIDDSISKRFDFMLNKKKSSSNSNSRKNSISKPKAIKKKKHGKQTTMAAILEREKSELNDSLQFDELFDTTNKSKNVEDVSNKENVPPSINGPLKSELELDFDVLNFSNGDMKNEISWLNDFNYFDSPSLIINDQTALSNTHLHATDSNNHNHNHSNTNITGQFHSVKNTTPRDPNTCNTMPIENEESGLNEENENENDPEHIKNIVITSDIDRTSPIDTLSMPLMDLAQQKQLDHSCGDQLKRLPLMMHKTSNLEPQVKFSRKPSVSHKTETVDEYDDTTSVMTNFSTPNEPEKSKNDFGDEAEEEEESDMKKQRIMPSSPSMMFNYAQDNENETDDSNDLFSSFVVDGSNEESRAHNNDSTPATQYHGQSSDPNYQLKN